MQELTALQLKLAAPSVQDNTLELDGITLVTSGGALIAAESTLSIAFSGSRFVCGIAASTPAPIAPAPAPTSPDNVTETRTDTDTDRSQDTELVRIATADELYSALASLPPASSEGAGGTSGSDSATAGDGDPTVELRITGACY